MSKEPMVFPEFVKSGDSAVATGGLSLRDYFAIKAMEKVIERGIVNDCPFHATAIANVAYEMADAMLAEREEGERK